LRREKKISTEKKDTEIAREKNGKQHREMLIIIIENWGEK